MITETLRIHSSLLGELRTLSLFLTHPIRCLFSNTEPMLHHALTSKDLGWHPCVVPSPSLSSVSQMLYPRCTFGMDALGPALSNTVFRAKYRVNLNIPPLSTQIRPRARTLGWLPTWMSPYFWLFCWINFIFFFLPVWENLAINYHYLYTTFINFSKGKAGLW